MNCTHELTHHIKYIWLHLLQWKGDFIRGVSSLWGENLEVFNSVYLKSGMIKSGGIWWGWSHKRGIIVQDNYCMAVGNLFSMNW